MNPNIVPATIHDDRKIVSGSRVVPATPTEVFDVLADPAKHSIFDGSGTVKGARTSERLSKGARFGMDMKLIIPYRMSNTVTEFEEDRLIEWTHIGGHRWRYELEAVAGGTRVTESFNWGAASLPSLYFTLTGFTNRNRESIDQTLERLQRHFE